VAPTSDPTPLATTSAPTGDGRRKRKTRTALRITDGARPLASRAVARRSRKVSFGGVVTGATGGRVEIRLQRLSGPGGGPRSRVVSVRVSATGRFLARAVLHGIGRWRVQAAYGGSDSQLPSTSRFTYVRV
jgi:hypothetical protein